MYLPEWKGQVPNCPHTEHEGASAPGDVGIAMQWNSQYVPSHFHDHHLFNHQGNNQEAQELAYLGSGISFSGVDESIIVESYSIAVQEVQGPSKSRIRSHVLTLA